MTDALRDAWLAEMWAPVREVPREEREAQRALWEVHNAGDATGRNGIGRDMNAAERERSLQSSPRRTKTQVKCGKMKGAPGGQTRCAAPPSSLPREAAP